MMTNKQADFVKKKLGDITEPIQMLLDAGWVSGEKNMCKSLFIFLHDVNLQFAFIEQMLRETECKDVYWERAKRFYPSLSSF